MKRVVMKRLLIAGIALLTASSVFAQKENDKEDKTGKPEEFQTIVITRNGNLDKKTVVEINGDIIKVNGKDAAGSKDVHVNINTFKGNDGRMKMYNRTPGAGGWNFNMDGNQMSLFSEDENRAMLGVTTEANDKGAEIESVVKESAAEKAGLQKGDVITKIDDKKIENTDDVTEAVRKHKPGDKVSITYLRDGKEQKTTSELTKWKGIRMNTINIPQLDGLNKQMEGLDQQWKEMMPEHPFGNSFDRPKLGLSIQDTEDGLGVKVLDVDDDSPAAKAGIRKDDIITGVGTAIVNSTDDVIKAMRDNKEKTSCSFVIKRDGKTQTIEVKIPRKLKTADL